MPHLALIRSAAGALGRAPPTTDLVVSLQHRIALEDRQVEHYFGEHTVLAPTKALRGDRGVTIDRSSEGIAFCLLLPEQHHLARASGPRAETLLTGTRAPQSMMHDQLIEIASVFQESDRHRPIPAGPVISTREARTLLHRGAESPSERLRFLFQRMTGACCTGL